MRDVIIVIVSSISFLLFVIGLIVSVRAKGQAEILTSMKKLYLVLSMVGSIFIWLIFRDTNIVDTILFIVLYLVLFWAMSFSYILGLFGIPLTSVRMQFLLTLAAHGDRGADIQVMRKAYSKESILAIRLHRLETSGEIIRKGNYYALRSRWSYFVIHNIFLLFLIKLFQPLE